ncbi:MAG: hypothetical protein OXG80_08180 [Chloroflexi bacterium]|nr:hypothetical protein [Chloroflexota bacterium]
MRQVDKIRQYAADNFIRPARLAGKEHVTVCAGDVNKAMVGDGLLPNSRLPNVCNALRGKDFLDLANVELLETVGPYESTTTAFRYRILNVADNIASERKYDHNENVREYIFQLTPGEFQELAREYLKVKGFDDAEIEIVIRMKM